MEFLPTAYWVMAIIGTLVTLVLLFVGADHDFGHGGMDLGHGDVGHVGVGHHDMAGQHGDEGPGPISMRTILAFKVFDEIFLLTGDTQRSLRARGRPRHGRHCLPLQPLSV